MVVQSRPPPDVARQSGVAGITWHRTQRCWKCQWIDRAKRFKPNKNTPEDIEDARMAAVDFFRTRKEQIYTVRPGPPDMVQQSGVVGVKWHTTNKYWECRWKDHMKKVRYKCFKPKEYTPEEIEGARLAAVDFFFKLKEQIHMANPV